MMDLLNLSLGIILILQLIFMSDYLPKWWQFFMMVMAAINIALVII